MSSKSSAILALAAGASLVSAHGYVSSWTIGDVDYAGFDEQWAVAAGTDTGNEFIAWSTSASDNGYVAPDAYTSSDIICHKDATNGALNNATAAAGSTVTATWNTWPSSHKGPIITYIAAADDPTTVDKTTLEWIKIQQGGLVDASSGSNGGTWVTDELITNNYAYDITIPSTLKPGNYVIRHEIIALHSAENADGAQNYPQCVNLAVTGSGSDLPDGTLGTALYTETDTSIVFNIYESFSSYDIPGPALAFTDSSSSGSSDSSSSAAATTTAAATTAAPVATSSSAVATSSAVSTSSADAAANAAAPTSASSAAAPAATKSSCKKRRHARQIKN